MLTALDTIIANGTGGRLPLALKRFCELRLRIGADADAEILKLLDDGMAGVAQALGEEAVMQLAPEAERMTEALPAFAAALGGRARAIAESRARRKGPTGEPASFRVAERRSTPRNAATEADNPIALARRASPEELARIAELPALPESITNVIVQRAIRPVLLTALANPGAQFSRSSLVMLVAIAPGDRAMLAALATRRDLPDTVQAMLQPLLPRAA